MRGGVGENEPVEGQNGMRTDRMCLVEVLFPVVCRCVVPCPCAVLCLLCLCIWRAVKPKHASVPGTAPVLRICMWWRQRLLLQCRRRSKTRKEKVGESRARRPSGCGGWSGW